MGRINHFSCVVGFIAPLACAACELAGPDTITIQVQDQLATAEDGLPIIGASVRFVFHEPVTFLSYRLRTLGGFVLALAGSIW